MAFGYARVKPDAFSDIADVRVRNDRIMQDIANQKRNWEAQQAAAEFDAWQKQNARNNYGYYNKGLAVQNGFKAQPFAGTAPSIPQGLASLGITPDGKLTFGSHGSNMVMPLRRRPVFKTDENGNPTPLSADEEAILQQESDKTSQQAAAEAASGAPVQNGGDGSSSIENSVNSQASQWYDFLKHPQNTPYELEQMRNQGILRDASIAAAMNKPVFFPEADTLSEPMAKLAGQQSGLAQSAMQQFTVRQGMAGDAYKMATGLATQYASNAIQADIQARKFKADSEESQRNANVIGDQAKALYGQMPNEMKALSGKPEFLEVVRNKYNEKMQNLAQAYDALKRQQAVFQNDAQSKAEQAQSYLAKSKAFRNGASKVSKDWELGLDFGDGEEVAAPQITGNDIRFAGQGDIGENVARSYNFVVGKGGNKAPRPKNDVPEAPVYDAEGNLMFTPMLATEDSEKNKVFVEPDGSVYDSDKDPIRSSWNDLLGKDVAIANRRAWGSREHLDEILQANADNTQWLKEVQDLFGKILAEVRNNPANQAKYADILAPILAQADRFGLSQQVKNEELNIPRSNSLNAYENEILASGNPVLIGLWDSAKAGSISETWLKDFEKQLSTQFETKNASGRNDVLLRNNGLKLNYTLDKKNKTKGGNPKYFVKFVDSFK